MRSKKEEQLYVFTHQPTKNWLCFNKEVISHHAVMDACTAPVVFHTTAGRSEAGEHGGIQL